MALAGAGLGLAIVATLWFFGGFFETDPGFSPASSALLLSFGLGAFAIIPCAVILRLAHSAWRHGFRQSHGVWTLFLVLPWLALAVISLRSEWLPVWLGLIPIAVGLPLALWAAISLALGTGDRQRTD